MNWEAELSTAQPRRPFLFYAPSCSGKTRLLTSMLQSRGFQVLCGEPSDFPFPLQSTTCTGHNTAYIVKLQSLQRLPTVAAPSHTVVLYTSVDPYNFASAAELNAKFQLVDLGKRLPQQHCSSSWLSNSSIDLTSLRKPPWAVLSELCSNTRPYADKVDIVEANAHFPQTLRNNIELAPSKEAAAVLCDKLSELDLLGYVDQTAAHSTTMESMALIEGLCLTPYSRLNWKKAQHSTALYPQKPSTAYLSQFNVLNNPLFKAKPAARRTPPAEGDVASAAKRPRRAPQCKRCQKPMKGHIACGTKEG